MSLKRILKWSALLIAVALPTWAFVAYRASDNECGTRIPTPASEAMMAVTFCDYGSPDVLTLGDVSKPVPNDSQVLIRVRAASVNPVDWHLMEGTPYVGRLGMGLRKPKDIKIGVDFAGTVESVGKNVTRFKAGDEVFGGRTGSFAQYVVVREGGSLVMKPANVTFEQAAAVPVAAVTALQGLRDKGRVKAGEKVLINGASGGVGTFAVQIAKAFGANVTGVCSTNNAAMVRSLGADRVIDYKSQDFTTGTERYDLIVDNVGNHSLSEIRRVLTPNGRFVMVGGEKGRWLDPLPRALSAMLLSRFVSQELRFFIADLNTKDLTLLADLMQSGKVKPVIDRQYKLSEIKDAVRYQEEGHAKGKVVVTID